MEFKLNLILTFLFMVVVKIYAVAHPSENYWNSALPNTIMPKPLNNILNFRITNAGRKDLTPTLYTIDTPLLEDIAGVPLIIKNSGVANTSTQAQKIQYRRNNVAKISTVSLFFLEKDFQLGKSMNLYFPKSTNDAKFLPHSIARTLPFSSNKLPEILTKLSLSPTSDDARLMFESIQMCEGRAMPGEERICATSMESMVDFIASKLAGKNVEALSTSAANSETKEYTIVGSNKMSVRGDSVVSCHKMQYPYAAFYCHTTSVNDAYKVSLEGTDGSSEEAVALCHKDTSEWDPEHVVFKELKVKPGHAPICHFLVQDHVVFVGSVNAGILEEQ